MKSENNARVPVPERRYLGGSAGQSKGGHAVCTTARVTLKMKTKQQ